MDIKQLLKDKLSGSATQAIANKYNLDATTADAAVDSAVNVLLSGLKDNSKTTTGATALNETLAAKHDGSILNDILGAVTDPNTSLDGTKILGHVFENNSDQAVQKVAKNAGVSPTVAAAILSIVAPLVLGQLGKTKASASDGIDIGELLSMFGGGSKSSGGIMGIVMRLVSALFSKK